MNHIIELNHRDQGDQCVVISEGEVFFVPAKLENEVRSQVWLFLLVHCIESRNPHRDNLHDDVWEREGRFIKLRLIIQYLD